MNKTFLIFLMIGTAMMIAVIGQHTPKVQLDYMPWQIDILDDGTSRAFGITLGKTTVQEANQIFANFAETRLYSEPSGAEALKHRLVARYNQLTIGGLVAEIQLDYQIKKSDLQSIYKKLTSADSNNDPAINQPLAIDKDTEMNFLNTVVERITYIPAIDFGEDIIRQRFGQAAEEVKLNENTQRWIYPQLGLIINIHQDKEDEFIYSSLK